MISGPAVTYTQPTVGAEAAYQWMQSATLEINAIGSELTTLKSAMSVLQPVAELYSYISTNHPEVMENYIKYCAMKGKLGT